MTANLLIRILQKITEQYGDLQVGVEDAEFSGSYLSISRVDLKHAVHEGGLLNDDPALKDIFIAIGV